MTKKPVSYAPAGVLGYKSELIIRWRFWSCVSVAFLFAAYISVLWVRSYGNDWDYFAGMPGKANTSITSRLGCINVFYLSDRFIPISIRMLDRSEGRRWWNQMHFGFWHESVYWEEGRPTAYMVIVTFPHWALLAPFAAILVFGIIRAVAMRNRKMKRELSR